VLILQLTRKTKWKASYHFTGKEANRIVNSGETCSEISEEYLHLKKENRNLSLVKTLFEHLLNNGSNGRKMFNIVTKTWNPVTGCSHDCVYCWARELASTKLRNSHRYKNGFQPRINEIEFQTKFKERDFVFVSDMGDLFGHFAPSEWILRVLEHAARFPRAFFLFLTKNPARYEEFLNRMPNNAILGTTIETNRDQRYLEFAVSQAPRPSMRYEAMKKLEWDKKFVSVEPIMDFDLEVMRKWIEEIFPFLVYVGYDNYNHQLLEPPLNKTLQFLEEVSTITLVVKKTIRRAWFESLESQSKGVEFRSIEEI
jgi:DNA repair photolyase